MLKDKDINFLINRTCLKEYILLLVGMHRGGQTLVVEETSVTGESLKKYITNKESNTAITRSWKRRSLYRIEDNICLKITSVA